jgi:hypothetical protein
MSGKADKKTVQPRAPSLAPMRRQAVQPRSHRGSELLDQGDQLSVLRFQVSVLGRHLFVLSHAFGMLGGQFVVVRVFPCFLMLHHFLAVMQGVVFMGPNSPRMDFQLGFMLIQLRLRLRQSGQSFKMFSAPCAVFREHLVMLQVRDLMLRLHVRVRFGGSSQS